VDGAGIFACDVARHPNRSDLKEAVMQRRQALKLFARLALCPLCASTNFASEGHWSYDDTAVQ